MSKVADDHRVHVFESGTWGVVVGLKDKTGGCAAKVYLDGLPAEARAKFQVAAKRLAELGAIKNDQVFHQLHHDGRPQVWEIKVNHGPGHRFFCIRRDSRWLITHAGPKPKRNTLYATEVERCHRALDQWDRGDSGDQD